MQQFRFNFYYRNLNCYCFVRIDLFLKKWRYWMTPNPIFFELKTTTHWLYNLIRKNNGAIY